MAYVKLVDVVTTIVLSFAKNEEPSPSPSLCFADDDDDDDDYDLKAEREREVKRGDLQSNYR